MWWHRKRLSMSHVKGGGKARIDADHSNAHREARPPEGVRHNCRQDEKRRERATHAAEEAGLNYIRLCIGHSNSIISGVRGHVQRKSARAC